MTTPTFDAILFDLDGTLLDRNAVFVNVARDFYDAYLHNRAHHTRDKAVAMMVEWDGEGYTDRQWMRSQWLKHWPDTGFDMQSLETWYRSAMVRNIQPDPEIIDYLTTLNRQQMPWGIVTNGPLTQRDKCRSRRAGANCPLHHRLRRSRLLQARPQNLPRRPQCHRPHQPGTRHLRWRQPRRRHRRRKTLRHDGRLAAHGQKIPAGTAPVPTYTIDHVLDAQDIVSTA